MNFDPIPNSFINKAGPIWQGVVPNVPRIKGINRPNPSAYLVLIEDLTL
jgi:hypothetical protein